MKHFCTLFDSGYLTRGLALYESLEAQGEPFLLHIYCFDDLAHELLSKLALKNARLVKLTDFETPELLAVKPGRTRGEYCWTCASHTIRHCLDANRLSQVTYLDADLYFFAPPSLLFAEFEKAGASVLITEHRYAPEYDQSATSGKYCVQFVVFNNDAPGRVVLDWWCARCLEWCFNRFEDGKFGDQKYLDDWTTRFKGVHVLEHRGGGVAPWNIRQYSVASGPAGRWPLIDGHPLVFHHFHALKWFDDGRIDLADGYRLPPEAVSQVYEPYLAALKAALARVRHVQPGFNLGKIAPRTSWRDRLRSLKRTLNGTNHVVSE